MTPINLIQLDAFNRLASTLKDGKRIEAIKLVRELTNATLREAKDWVDDVCPYQPAHSAPATYKIVGQRFGETQWHWESYAYLDSAIAAANRLCDDEDWTDISVVQVKAKSKLTVVAV